MFCQNLKWTRNATPKTWENSVSYSYDKTLVMATPRLVYHMNSPDFKWVLPHYALNFSVSYVFLNAPTLHAAHLLVYAKWHIDSLCRV